MQAKTSTVVAGIYSRWYVINNRRQEELESVALGREKGEDNSINRCTQSRRARRKEETYQVGAK